MALYCLPFDSTPPAPPRRAAALVGVCGAALCALGFLLGLAALVRFALGVF